MNTTDNIKSLFNSANLMATENSYEPSGVCIGDTVLDNTPSGFALFQAIGGHYTSPAQAIEELVDNAISSIRANGGSGKVILCLTDGGGYVDISVCDSGTGISNLGAALTISGCGGAQTPLNEHGCGLKNALSYLCEEVEVWLLESRTKEDAAAVDADLKAGGGHIALIVGGILLIRLDGAVAAADGDLTTAEVHRRLRQLHRVFLPERLERLEPMAALGSVLLAADDADGDAALCEDGRIGVGEFLFEVAAQLTEVCLGALRCGLEALELLLAAADADSGAGLKQNGTAALMDLCAHLPVNGGIGRGYAAVSVRRRVLLGAALKEPQLVLLAEIGEGVLQAAAMLIQRRLRPAAAGDGQSRAEVRDAGAAVRRCRRSRRHP